MIRRLLGRISRMVRREPTGADVIKGKAAFAGSELARTKKMVAPKPGTDLIRSIKPARDGERRFQLIKADDLDGFPDPEWLIEGILPEDSLSMLYGEAGAGKSFLALDWACCIDTGSSWLEHETKKGDVVYVCAEGRAGLKPRLRAWRCRFKAKLNSLYFLPHSLDIRSKADVEELIDAIQRCPCKPRLIVIDTLARCYGDGDENAPKDMNAFVNGADTLRVAFPSSTVLVVHHSGKDVRRGDRGHSALRAAVNTMIQLTQDKIGHRLTMECKKQKDAAEFDAMYLRLTEVELDDGQKSCVVALASTPAMTGLPTTKSDIKALEVLTKCGENGATYTDWKEASDLPDSTFKDVRKRLERGVHIKQLEDGRYVATSVGPKAETGPDPPLLSAA